jgi:hypothetical protein
VARAHGLRCAEPLRALGSDQSHDRKGVIPGCGRRCGPMDGDSQEFTPLILLG